MARLKIKDLPKSHKYIYDENLEPLFLGKSTTVGGGWTLYKRAETEKGKFADVLAYPSSLNNALKAASMQLLDIKSKSQYNSVKEYIEEWNQVKESMKNILDI